MNVFILIVVMYLLVVFVGIRLVIPYFGFKQNDVPDEIPADFEYIIKRISQESNSDLEYLYKSYNYLTSRYHGSRILVVTRWWYAFTNIFRLKDGFIPCTLHNQLLRIMLVKSGRFSNADIQQKVSFLNFFIHQYLRVRVEDRWIDVDPSFQSMGVPFGKKASLFV